MAQQTVNHRTISGQKKSLARRKSLLAATMRVIGAKKYSFPTIEDVVKEADVARGTFYKHFTSLDQAVEETGLLLAEEFIAAINPIHSNIPSPIHRVSLGTRLLQTTAYKNKEWARFMLRSNLTDPQSRLMQTIQKDVSDGMKLDKFVKADPGLTTQLVMGINWATVERLIDGPSTPSVTEIIDYSILTMLLALGVPRATTLKAVAYSRDFLKNSETAWEE